MSGHSAKRSRVDVGGSYRDQIPLEEDFEVVNARTASLSGPNNLPMAMERSSLSSTWTIGDSWAPEENHDFSLDPDDGWYDEAVKANVCDVMEELVAPKKRNKRSEASVRLSSVLYPLILTFFAFCRHGHMFSGEPMPATSTSTKC